MHRKHKHDILAMGISFYLQKILGSNNPRKNTYLENGLVVGTKMRFCFSVFCKRLLHKLFVDISKILVGVLIMLLQILLLRNHSLAFWLLETGRVITLEFET